MQDTSELFLSLRYAGIVLHWQASSAMRSTKSHPSPSEAASTGSRWRSPGGCLAA